MDSPRRHISEAVLASVTATMHRMSLEYPIPAYEYDGPVPVQRSFDAPTFIAAASHRPDAKHSFDVGDSAVENIISQQSTLLIDHILSHNRATRKYDMIGDVERPEMQQQLPVEPVHDEKLAKGRFQERQKVLQLMAR
jgi:hypothetical protein